jgi:ketosteroid isomerase-like protein
MLFRIASSPRRQYGWAVLLACIATAPYVVCRAAPTEVPDELPVDALTVDREFAQWALDAGTRAAYDRYLADDAVMFRPQPVPAREWLTTHEPATGRLEWAPTQAATACDASLAVTLGTWTYTAKDSPSPDTGQYLTAWRRSESGDWRIVLDHTLSLPSLPAPIVTGSAPCDGVELVSDKLLAADRKQNSHLRTVRTNATTTLAVRAVPRGTVTGSARADLALTHGALLDKRAAGEGQQEVIAVYVRVWQRTGRAWRVAHEFISPATP